MSPSSATNERDAVLTELQRTVLLAIADVQPRPVLFGGAALALAHGSGRPTDDIDLMWTPADGLDDLPQQIADRLEAAGLEVTREVTAPRFARIRVTRDGETTKLDLVAQPLDSIRERVSVVVGGTSLWVPSATDLLADKLCALLSRAEARDLADAAFLLQRGADWHEAMLGAADRDGGFSPLTLAWVLRSFPIAALERTSGIDDLAALRQTLLDRIVDES